MSSKTKKDKTPRIVLVGTYKGDQLEKWCGWYNYPMDAGYRERETGNSLNEKHEKGKGFTPERDAPMPEMSDCLNETPSMCRRGGRETESAEEDTARSARLEDSLARVTELWLFKGTRDGRRYRAEFVGVKTREELIRDYGYPGDVLVAKNAKHGDASAQPPKPHASHYALYKTEFLYCHKFDVPEDAETVLVRVSDFAMRSPKIAKQLKEYLESPDRRDPDLAKRLPTIVTKVPPERLCVCEASTQLEFVFLYSGEESHCREVSSREALPVISLFSGAGGLDIGFEQAGFRTAVMVELDPACCRTLRRNMPNVPILEGDINQMTTSTILSAAGLEPLEAALVIGGPPCQSFSLAGKRMGLNDPRGRLVLEFIRIVREALPKAFVMENVKGLTNWEGGKALDAILNEAAIPIVYNGTTYSYKVTYHILNAADYGVPQFRERVFIVGNRVNCDFRFPEKQFGPVGNEEGLKPYKTVRDAICGLPPATPPSEVALRVSGTIRERIEKHGY
ncbi:MAG: DNA cytosine methyltransferase [Victivallales bacterium]|nr:DNA cytosine methyltransferase [Victivallales bacterium]